MSSVMMFIVGLGIGLCGWLVHVSQLSAGYALDRAAQIAAAESMRGTLVRMRAERAEEHRAAMLETLTLPPVPARYVVQPSPSIPATVPDPSIPEADVPARTTLGLAVEILDGMPREALRCATIRREYDRTHCFDIACPRCFPRPQDIPTGALQLSAMVS